MPFSCYQMKFSSWKFQLKKENPLSWSLQSSLNIHLAERQGKGVWVEKGSVVITRLGS